jgi:hypothetical protein
VWGIVAPPSALEAESVWMSTPKQRRSRSFERRADVPKPRPSGFSRTGGGSAVESHQSSQAVRAERARRHFAGPTRTRDIRARNDG